MSDDRFAFGENWKSFLQTLDEERIGRAGRSLAQLLDFDPAGDRPLEGQSFLDLGCGSGLFSLAAFRFGADVVSVDYDRQCVACAEQLRQREGPDAEDWKIRPGSALDQEAMRALGQFDIVYSWGVLHHTGDMHRAIDLAAAQVLPEGRLAIAIYNDQGRASRRWLTIKQTYHSLPGPLRSIWVAMIASWYEAKFAAVRLVRGRNPLPFADWRQKKLDRGMSVWHDWVDWVGGLPFEVAKPDDIIDRLEQKGFRLKKLNTVGNGWGCNEYVFARHEF